MRLQLPTPDAPLSRLWLCWLRLMMHALRERTLWLALLVGAAALTVAYQGLRPRPLTLDIGSEGDRFFTTGFHGPEKSGSASFRWSMGESTLWLQGVGKPLITSKVGLQMSAGPRPGPVLVDVRVNGHPLPPLTLDASSKLYHLQVDPAWVDLSGDLRLDFSTQTFQPPGDRRDLGFILDLAQVEIPTGLTLPSLTQLGQLLLCAALLYLMLRMVWLRPAPSGIIAALFLLAAAGGIALQRLAVTIFTAQIAFTLALAILIALLAESLVRVIAHSVGWRGMKSLPEWMWTGLRGLVLVTVALKVGGLLHPYAFIIDAPFHIKYITYMTEVRPWEEYFGESLAFSVMPKEEWGAARAFIPYTPFFYLIASPLSILPLPLTLSVPLAAAIFESLKVALVFLIGLALGRGDSNPNAAARWALSAGAVYAFIPATFLLQQWGNWPTQSSLWLLTLWAALTTLLWRQITALIPWLITTAALALTFLAYTVSVIYTGLFVGFLVLAGWLFAPAHNKRWNALALSLVAASLLALLIYYGQYVGKVLGDTLPTFGSAIEDQGKLTTLRPSLYDFVTDHLASAMQSYRLAIIYALGLAGALYLFFGGSRMAGKEQTRASWRNAHWQNVWLGVWLLMFPLFTLADFYVDQALKQFWFALPAVAVVGGGWLLSLLSRRARIHTLFATLIAATLVWQSLDLWVFRLFFHNR